MSKRILPKHETTLLLDDIREEKGGKFSLIGLYAKDIVLYGATLPVMLPKLCFFTRISDGEGDFDIKYSIKDPDGEELLINVLPQKMHAKKDNIGNLVFMLSPFNIKKQGEYKFEILIDNKAFYSLSFVVKIKSTEEFKIDTSAI